ncbi:MAG: DNA-directed RNA polymerase subunit omega [Thermodesulfobacteriota bacterium]
MARITIEDCLSKVNNRFSLIHIAAKRVRQLRKGAEPSVSSKNKDIVVALREIAAGNVEKSLRAAASGDLEAGAENVLLPGPSGEIQERAAGEAEKEA